MIDPRSDRPLYKQLADVLRTQIAAGELAPGARLPSETALAQTYGLARPAVRQAIALLRSEALVTTERGYGTRVRQTPDQQTVDLSTGDTVLARMPSERERSALDLDSGVPVLEVRHGEGPPSLHPADRTVLHVR